MEQLAEQLRAGVLGLFYLRNVTATCVQHVRDVPDYTRQAVPVFLLLTLAEFVFLQTRRRGRAAFADHTCSLASGLAHLVVSAAAGALPVWAYSQVWHRWRLVDLAWDAPAIWWLALLGVDLCFYWQHRMLHEVAVLWAMHQAHHSSEYFNLSAAQRQPVLQTFVTGAFYLPLAVLGVPPAMWLSHRAFNFIYQFWIHTELVGRLGPLELVFNTASHHRVHHATNPRYIDRNYGGFLIIWDRLFGTFCAEQEPPTYGLVHNVDSFDLVTVQLREFARLAAAAGAERSWADTARRLLYGPGWQPGGPRLGDPSTLPEPDGSRTKFTVPVQPPLLLYICVHFSLAGLVLVTGVRLSTLPIAVLLLISAVSISMLISSGQYGAPFEVTRCVIVLIWLLMRPMTSAAITVISIILFTVSLVLWMVCPHSFWYPGESYFTKAAPTKAFKPPQQFDAAVK